MRKSFSRIPLKLFPNGESLIKSAIDGEISGFVSDYPKGYYHLILQHNLVRFETGPTPFTRPIQIAARLGDSAKLNRVAANVAEIPRVEIHQALNKWPIPEDELPPWIWPTVIAAILAFVNVAIGTRICLAKIA